MSPERIRALVVEDNPSARILMETILEERGYEVSSFEDAEQAQKRWAETPFELALLDVQLPGQSGLSLCRRARKTENGRETRVLVVTARSGEEVLEEVLSAGADDYISKPFDLDLLNFRLELAEREFEQARARSTPALPGTSSYPTVSPCEDMIIGGSRSMRHLYGQIERAAGCTVTVLIRGETGTGKELAARALHRLGGRADKPFVAVNCSAIPESLIESHLFGHKKGAFTGADRDRIGVFREASGGTLFLDEIGDVKPDVQVKLLRALQERRVRPVGDNRDYDVDVRVVTATHRDLEAMLETGELRSDFYYRIRVLELNMPPLRERGDDILLLAHAFLKEQGRELGREVRGFSAEAVQLLVSHDWPGNVRELENVVLRSIVMASGELVQAHDLPPDLHGTGRKLTSTTASRTGFPDRAEMEREEVLRALHQARGVKSRAAELLGISRTGLWKRMKRLGLHEST